MRDIVNRNIGYADGVGGDDGFEEKRIRCSENSWCRVLVDIIKEFEKEKTFYFIGSSSAVKKGCNYILNNFLDEDHFLFKRFAISNKPSLVKFDLYDNAEMPNLAILLRGDVAAKKLDEVIKKTFVQKNKIYSTINIFSFKKNTNHLRWAVMPYLHALSGLKEK